MSEVRRFKQWVRELDAKLEVWKKKNGLPAFSLAGSNQSFCYIQMRPGAQPQDVPQDMRQWKQGFTAFVQAHSPCQILVKSDFLRDDPEEFDSGLALAETLGTEVLSIDAETFAKEKKRMLHDPQIRAQIKAVVESGTSVVQAVANDGTPLLIEIPNRQLKAFRFLPADTTVTNANDFDWGSAEAEAFLQARARSIINYKTADDCPGAWTHREPKEEEVTQLRKIVASLDSQAAHKVDDVVAASAQLRQDGVRIDVPPEWVNGVNEMLNRRTVSTELSDGKKSITVMSPDKNGNTELTWEEIRSDLRKQGTTVGEELRPPEPGTMARAFFDDQQRNGFEWALENHGNHQNSVEKFVVYREQSGGLLAIFRDSSGLYLNPLPANNKKIKQLREMYDEYSAAIQVAKERSSTLRLGPKIRVLLTQQSLLGGRGGQEAQQILDLFDPTAIANAAK